MSEAAVVKIKGWAVLLGEAAAVLGVGFVAILIITKIARKALERSSMDPALHKFILNFLRVLLWVLVLISVFARLGVSVTSFVAVLGAAGAAVALALKDSLANVAGGIIIAVSKPFLKDEYISVLETEGKVETIDLLYTTLKTLDNKMVKIPNGKISSEVLINYTRENLRRVDCVFFISYEASLPRAKEILAEVSRSCEEILNCPEPIIGVAEHQNSSIAMDLKVWCETSRYWDVKYYLEERVKLAFDEAGIEIPYPQMDIYVKRRQKAGS